MWFGRLVSKIRLNVRLYSQARRGDRDTTVYSHETTRLHIKEDSSLNSHSRGNLGPNTIILNVSRNGHINSSFSSNSSKCWGLFWISFVFWF